MNAIMEHGLPHRITVDEYYRMAEAGLLAPDARVELIEGEIIDMPPIGSLHAGTVDQLAGMLHHAVTGRATVRCQTPVRLSRYSEPQPDIVLVKPRSDFYKREHPGAQDILLIVEVSDTTLQYDLRVKVPFYAGLGVPEVWLVDLEHHELRTFRYPTSGGYAEIRATSTPGRTSIFTLPEISVDLSGLFDL